MAKAIVILRPDGGSNVNGTVTFEQPGPGQPTRVRAIITGLAPGKHGFHIHQWGDLREGCKTAGAHFNPKGKNHGGPYDEERHVGDLGNIIADADGKAEIVEEHLLELFGEHTVIGRAVVVHADEDDLGKGGQTDSLTTGHAGARLACGIIGLTTN